MTDTSSSAGSQDSVPSMSIARYAEGLARRAGHSLKLRHRIRMANVSLRDTKLTAEQRMGLAIACDLFDLLADSPDGRQALSDLGLQPISEHAKSE